MTPDRPGRPAKPGKGRQGRRLFRARRRARLTQAEAARHLGVPENTYARWEREALVLDKYKLAGLLAALEQRAKGEA